MSKTGCVKERLSQRKAVSKKGCVKGYNQGTLVRADDKTKEEEMENSRCRSARVRVTIDNEEKNALIIVHANFMPTGFPFRCDFRPKMDRDFRVWKGWRLDLVASLDDCVRIHLRRLHSSSEMAGMG